MEEGRGAVRGLGSSRQAGGRAGRGQRGRGARCRAPRLAGARLGRHSKACLHPRGGAGLPAPPPLTCAPPSPPPAARGGSPRTARSGPPSPTAGQTGRAGGRRGRGQGSRRRRAPARRAAAGGSARAEPCGAHLAQAEHVPALPLGEIFQAGVRGGAELHLRPLVVGAVAQLAAACGSLAARGGRAPLHAAQLAALPACQAGGGAPGPAGAEQLHRRCT